ncbi:MAG TPA: hypothetical protein VET27_00385 [Mycobacterium sp.]|nr:hypothetical protein [Mycobacterium sp.]
MTATIITRPLSDSSDSLLRFAMRVDATISALLGLLVVLAAEPLGRLTGLSPTTEWIVGASFIAISAAVYCLASLPNIRLAGTALMLGNLAFTVVLVGTVLAGWLPLTEFGVMMTLATGLYTLAIAYVQYLGVRRLAWLPPIRCAAARRKRLRRAARTGPSKTPPGRKDS